MRTTLQRRVKELSRQENRPRAFRGRLAEDYDGIGQYVLVSLSSGSVSSAYKARIASGDFGTNQRIPKGSLVTVISYHGQIEIISLGAK
jgi:hypothetical protein